MNNMSGKFAERNLTALSRIVGIFTAIVTCGVGADFVYHGHNLGFYVLASSAIIFFLEMQWVIDLLVKVFVRCDEGFGIRCWSVTLVVTSGWRRALFYLPIAFVLIWKPYDLWLAFFDAGLLVILSLIYATSNTLDDHSNCDLHQAANIMDQSLLNTNSDCYHHFDEVLVTEVMDDYVPNKINSGENKPAL